MSCLENRSKVNGTATNATRGCCVHGFGDKVAIKEPNGRTMTKPPQLGRRVPIPASPQDAVLDRVPNPHADNDYVARFTFPEFTAICPVTGQPDFATLVIDYVPGRWLVESKSLKLYLNSFRNHGVFHGIVRSRSAKKWSPSSSRNGFASAAIFIRAAGCRSMCSGRPGNCRRAYGRRIRGSPRIGRAVSETSNKERALSAEHDSG